MKIAILGTSGSGKSTLAQTLGATYHAPVLHLDTVHFLPGWVERPLDEENAIVRRFLDTHESWIIDGNYTMTGGWKKQTRSSCSALAVSPA